MSKQLDVLAALKMLIRAALPAVDIDVIAPGDDDPGADRVAPGGRVVIEYGDPGEPEIDLSPVSYNYDHQIPLTIAASRALAGESAVAAVATMLTAIGSAIAADRQLGGAVDYLDGTAPPIDSLFEVGATPVREAQAVLIASYSTSSPL